MIKKLNILLLTMLGVGNSKYAPGTVASFITCLLYIYFYNYDINIFFIILGIIIIFLFSVYAIDKFSNSFSEIDAKEIVIDEFIGQSIPVITLYNFIEKNNLNHFILYTLIAFILFRIFDILKPYPINKIDEKIKNGFGVILDDIVAGVYSSFILIIIIFLTTYA
jgi:phosphatidylglycerophosphatase A